MKVCSSHKPSEVHATRSFRTRAIQLYTTKRVKNRHHTCAKWSNSRCTNVENTQTAFPIARNAHPAPPSRMYNQIMRATQFCCETKKRTWCKCETPVMMVQASFLQVYLFCLYMQWPSIRINAFFLNKCMKKTSYSCLKEMFGIFKIYC